MTDALMMRSGGTRTLAVPQPARMSAVTPSRIRPSMIPASQKRKGVTEVTPFLTFRRHDAPRGARARRDGLVAAFAASATSEATLAASAAHPRGAASRAAATSGTRATAATATTTRTSGTAGWVGAAGASAARSTGVGGAAFAGGTTAVVVVTAATDCRDARAERDHRKQTCQLVHCLILPKPSLTMWALCPGALHASFVPMDRFIRAPSL